MRNVVTKNQYIVPERVINYFMCKTNSSEEYAVDVFDDLILYLRSEHPGDVPSQIIDEAWHSFILHTKDYELFCNNLAGRFLHHYPKEAKDGSGFKCGGCHGQCSNDDCGGCSLE